MYAKLCIFCEVNKLEKDLQAAQIKQAVSLSIGYTFEKLEFETLRRFTSSTNMDYTHEPRNLDTERIGIKLGYEL